MKTIGLFALSAALLTASYCVAAITPAPGSGLLAFWGFMATVVTFGGGCAAGVVGALRAFE